MIHDSFLKNFRETKSPFITNPYRFVSGDVGGWVELGRTTLGSASDNITVSSLADKRYYMILADKQTTGSNGRINYRLNGDSGSNYHYRYSVNGGADGTARDSQILGLGHSSANTFPEFTVSYLSNLSSKEKLFIGHAMSQQTSGAGTAPSRLEHVAKWANTTNTINQIQGFNDYSTSTLDTGSELVILGWDPEDTHTTNFWEELASVELGSAGDTLSSGTISAKKYLWVQCYIKPSGATASRMRFNNDTGNNYAWRYSDLGGTDGTATNSNITVMHSGAPSVPYFFNTFIVNNSGNEKLGINHSVGVGTAGAGNAPNRLESVFKWVNTSSQITEIDIDNTYPGDFASGSILKVWGSD